MKLLLLAVALASVSAVVRRDDKPDSDFIVKASDYPFLVILNNDDNLKSTNTSSNEFNVDCAGTVISNKHIITAAHCQCDGASHSGYSVNVGGDKRKVVKTYFDPGCKFSCKHGGEPNKCDMAILELDDTVSATPIPVYNGTDEVGKTIHFLGWGVSGRAGQIKSRDCDDGPEDGNVRRGMNVVTKANGVIKYVMDKPDDGALPLEAICASGDSGGPALMSVNGVDHLIGTNSGSDSDNGCAYGAVDQFCRLSEHSTYIQSVINGQAKPAKEYDYSDPDKVVVTYNKHY